MNYNVKLAEQVGIIGTIDPASVNGTAVSGWIPASGFERFAAIIQTGVVGGTIDAKLQQAQDAAGTGAKDITGKAISTIAQASASGKQATIDVRAEELDTNNGFGYIRVSITTGGASLVSAAVLGYIASQMWKGSVSGANQVQNV